MIETDSHLLMSFFLPVEHQDTNIREGISCMSRMDCQLFASVVESLQLVVALLDDFASGCRPLRA
jgi:hypothetical protein